jgi:hypothetical protein
MATVVAACLELFSPSDKSDDTLNTTLDDFSYSCTAFFFTEVGLRMAAVYIINNKISTFFYDKFNIRHVISAIFLRLLTAPGCIEAIIVDCDDVFLRFTNLLMNDATYLLDEAMTKLVMIHEFESQENPPSTVSYLTILNCVQETFAFSWPIQTLMHCSSPRIKQHFQ